MDTAVKLKVFFNRFKIIQSMLEKLLYFSSGKISN